MKMTLNPTSILQSSNRSRFGRIRQVVPGLAHYVELPKAVKADQLTFQWNGTGEINCYVDRTNEGRPLVLLHSINAASSAYEMKPLFEHYRERRPVIAPDLPGFGFSERSQRRYWPELYIETIANLLREVAGEPADVIALSLTCEFAARAAKRWPELFNSLSLFSPTGLRANQLDLPNEMLYNIFSFQLTSQGLFDLLTSKKSIQYFLGQNFVGDIPKAFVEYGYATAHQPGARHAPLYFISGQMFSTDIATAVYEKLQVPTLAIYDRDPNTRFEMLPQVLEKNPHWQARQISPSLGLPHWDLLEPTLEALETFWT